MIKGNIVTRPSHLRYKPGIISQNFTQTGSPDKTEFDVWVSAYGREMDTAYNAAGEEVPLAHHLFGKQPFTLKQVLPTTEQNIRNNPFVAISEIDPQITYCERGVYLGLRHTKQLCQSPWRVGVYTTIPIVHIDIEHEQHPQPYTTTLSDVAITRNDSRVNSEYAYRLDFLNTLTLEPSNIPIVSCDTTPLRMAQIDVTQTHQPCNVPVTAIFRKNGSQPQGSLAATKQQADQALIIEPSGVYSDGIRGRFGPNTSYQELCDNQRQSRQWFVTPTICDDGSIHPDARIIQTQINNSISTIDSNINPFLASRGISLRDQETDDIGDIDMYVVAERPICDYACFGVYPGLRIPSGTTKDAKRVLQQPTGNNGHVEALFDMQYMHYIRPEMYIRLYGQFAHSFTMDEERLANDTDTRNIGVPVRSDISWEQGTIYAEYGMHLHKYVTFTIGYAGYFRSNEY